MPSFLGRLLGLNFRTERLIMNLLGLVNSTLDWSSIKWTNKLEQIWNLSLSQGTLILDIIGEDTIKTVLSWIVITRIVLAHVYTFTYLSNIYSILTWSRPNLLLPWLVLSFFKNIVLEVIVIGVGLLLWYDKRYSLPIFLEFVFAKVVPLIYFSYNWYSNSCLFLEMHHTEKLRKLRSDSHLIATRLCLRLADSKYRTRSLTTLISYESYETYDSQDTMSRIIDDPRLTPAQKTMRILGLTDQDIDEARTRIREREVRRRLTELEDESFLNIRQSRPKFSSFMGKFDWGMRRALRDIRNRMTKKEMAREEAASDEDASRDEVLMEEIYESPEETVEERKTAEASEDIDNVDVTTNNEHVNENFSLNNPTNPTSSKSSLSRFEDSQANSSKEANAHVEHRSSSSKKRSVSDSSEAMKTKQIKLCSSGDSKVFEHKPACSSNKRDANRLCCLKDAKKSVEKSCSPVKLQALFNCNCIVDELSFKESMTEYCWSSNATMRTSTPNASPSKDEVLEDRTDSVNSTENLFTEGDGNNSNEDASLAKNCSFPLMELLKNDLDILKDVNRDDERLQNNLEAKLYAPQCSTTVAAQNLSEIVKDLSVCRNVITNLEALKAEKDGSKLRTEINEIPRTIISVTVASSTSIQRNNSSPLKAKNVEKVNLPEYSFGDANIPRFYKDSMKVFDGCYEKDFANNTELQCLLRQLEKKKWNIFSGQPGQEMLMPSALSKQDEGGNRLTAVQNLRIAPLTTDFETMNRYQVSMSSPTKANYEHLIPQMLLLNDEAAFTATINKPSFTKDVYTQTTSDHRQTSSISASESKKSKKTHLKRAHTKEQLINASTFATLHHPKSESRNSLEKEPSKPPARPKSSKLNDHHKKSPHMTKSPSDKDVCECKADCKPSNSSELKSERREENKRSSSKCKVVTFGTIPLSQVVRPSMFDAVVHRRKPPVYPKKARELPLQESASKRSCSIKKMLEASKRSPEKQSLHNSKRFKWKSGTESLEEREAREMRALKAYNEVTLLRDKKELESKRKMSSRKNSLDLHAENPRNRSQSKKNVDKFKKDPRNADLGKENRFADATTETEPLLPASREIKAFSSAAAKLVSLSSEKYAGSKSSKASKATDKLLENFDRLHGGQAKQDSKKSKQNVDTESRKQYTKYSKPKNSTDEENKSIVSIKKLEGAQKGRELERTPAKEDVRGKMVASKTSGIDKVDSNDGRTYEGIVEDLRANDYDENASGSIISISEDRDEQNDGILTTVKCKVFREIASSWSSSTVDQADDLQLPAQDELNITIKVQTEDYKTKDAPTLEMRDHVAKIPTTLEVADLKEKFEAIPVVAEEEKETEESKISLDKINIRSLLVKSSTLEEQLELEDQVKIDEVRSGQVSKISSAGTSKESSNESTIIPIESLSKSARIPNVLFNGHTTNSEELPNKSATIAEELRNGPAIIPKRLPDESKRITKELLNESTIAPKESSKESPVVAKSLPTISKESPNDSTIIPSELVNESKRIAEELPSESIISPKESPSESTTISRESANKSRSAEELPNESTVIPEESSTNRQPISRIPTPTILRIPSGNVDISYVPSRIILSNSSASLGNQLRFSSAFNEDRIRMLRDAFSSRTTIADFDLPGEIPSMLDIFCTAYEDPPIDDYIFESNRVFDTRMEEFPSLSGDQSNFAQAILAAIRQLQNFEQASQDEDPYNLLITSVDHDGLPITFEVGAVERFDEDDQGESEMASEIGINVILSLIRILRGLNGHGVEMENIPDRDENDEEEVELVEEEEEEKFEESEETSLEEERLLRFIKEDICTDIEFPILIRWQDLMPEASNAICSASSSREEPEEFDLGYLQAEASKINLFSLVDEANGEETKEEDDEDEEIFSEEIIEPWRWSEDAKKSEGSMQLQNDDENGEGFVEKIVIKRQCSEEVKKGDENKKLSIEEIASKEELRKSKGMPKLRKSNRNEEVFMEEIARDEQCGKEIKKSERLMKLHKIGEPVFTARFSSRQLVTVDAREDERGSLETLEDGEAGCSETETPAKSYTFTNLLKNFMGYMKIFSEPEKVGKSGFKDSVRNESEELLREQEIGEEKCINIEEIDGNSGSVVIKEIFDTEDDEYSKKEVEEFAKLQEEKFEDVEDFQNNFPEKISKQVEAVYESEEVEEVYELSEIETGSEFKKAEVISKSKEVDGIFKFKETDGICNSKEVEEISESKEADGISNFKEIEGISESKDIDGTDKFKKLEEAHKSMEEIPKSRNIKSIHESKKFDRISEFKEVTGISESKTVARISKSNEVEEISKSKGIDGIYESKEVETHKFKEAEEIPKCTNVEAITKFNDVTGISDSKETKITSESKEIDPIYNFNEVNRTFESRATEEMFESRKIEEIPECKEVEGIYKPKKSKEISESKQHEPSYNSNNVTQNFERKTAEEISESKEVKTMSEPKETEQGIVQQLLEENTKSSETEPSINLTETEKALKNLEPIELEDEENDEAEIFESKEKSNDFSDKTVQTSKNDASDLEVENRLLQLEEEISLKIIVIFWFLVFFFYIRYFYQKIFSFKEISTSTSTLKPFEIHAVPTSTTTFLQNSTLVDKITEEEEENDVETTEEEEEENDSLERIIDLEVIEVSRSIEYHSLLNLDATEYASFSNTADDYQDSSKETEGSTNLSTLSGSKHETETLSAKFDDRNDTNECNTALHRTKEVSSETLGRNDFSHYKFPSPNTNYSRSNVGDKSEQIKLDKDSSISSPIKTEFSFAISNYSQSNAENKLGIIELHERASILDLDEREEEEETNSESFRKDASLQFKFSSPIKTKFPSSNTTYSQSNIENKSGEIKLDKGSSISSPIEPKFSSPIRIQFSSPVSNNSQLNIENKSEEIELDKRSSTSSPVKTETSSPISNSSRSDIENKWQEIESSKHSSIFNPEERRLMELRLAGEEINAIRYKEEDDSSSSKSFPTGDEETKLSENLQSSFSATVQIEEEIPKRKELEQQESKSRKLNATFNIEEDKFREHSKEKKASAIDEMNNSETINSSESGTEEVEAWHSVEILQSAMQMGDSFDSVYTKISDGSKNDISVPDLGESSMEEFVMASSESLNHS